MRSRDGATPITPANIASGTITPGSSVERATPFAISHLTRYGSGKKSARKPKPGMIGVLPKSGAS
jgi:hypothetical protein